MIVSLLDVDGMQWSCWNLRRDKSVFGLKLSPAESAFQN